MLGCYDRCFSRRFFLGHSKPPVGVQNGLCLSVSGHDRLCQSCNDDLKDGHARRSARVAIELHLLSEDIVNELSNRFLIALELALGRFRAHWVRRSTAISLNVAPVERRASLPVSFCQRKMEVST